MNERIKDLLKQATQEVWGNNFYNGAPEFEGYEVDQEKFAELIVRECSQVCFDKAAAQAAICNRREVNESFGNGIKCLTYNIAGEEILGHFGVE